MIGLDTNVLIRYLVQDDPIQSKRANNIIEKEELIYINQIVLCETVWVLSRGYSCPKNTIIDALEKILTIRQFEIEDKNLIWAAIDIYKKTSADFSDCLIGLKNRHARCLTTITFDKKAASLSDFS